LEPSNPSHYSDFAHALFKRGEYENAIYWWQKQKVFNPRDEEPYLFSAKSFMKLNRFDDALKELRSLITRDPKNIDYQVRLIKTLLAAHRVDEAIDEYCKMIGNQPHFSKATYDTIRHYQRKGNHQKATRILNEALSSALQR
jgi:tetratricopeptide (TPR) repeat protein